MKNRKLIKNFFYNTIYQILVLIVPLITIPYVSRILGVTNIGIYQYSQSIATYFVLIGAVGTSLYGQREIAYLQEKSKERSIAFWEIEIFRIVAVTICTIGYGIVFGLHGQYSQIYLILILEVFATAFDISWLFMGMENFKLIVIRNMMIKLTAVIGVFLFVKRSTDLGIYTVCMTLPIFFGNISLWFSLKKYIVKVELSLKSVARGIKKRVSSILILFLPQIAQEVYLVLDKTMLGLLSSNIDYVGYYSQAQKLVKVILAIVTSLGTVMLPAMSAYFAKGDYEGIKKNIKMAFKVIFMLSFALLFGLCAIVPRFVPIFFGEGYEPVIGLIIVISPILVIIATSNVLGKQFLLPTNQQKAFTVSIFAGAGVNFIFNLILIHYWNAIGASIATVIAELAVTGVQCWYVRKQLPLRECLLSGVKYCFWGIVMFVICRGVGMLLPEGKIWVIVIMVGVGMFVYCGGLMISDDSMIKMGINILKEKKS